MRTTLSSSRTGLWTAAALAAVAFGGAVACDKDNGSATTTTNNTTTPTTPVAPESKPVTNTNAVMEKPGDPLAGVANRDQLVADPDAKTIDPPKSTYLVTGFSTLVRTGPRGSMTEAVETTANVKEVARDGDYFLITYPDPKGTNKTFAGWVYKDALAGEGTTLTVGAAPRAAGKLSCTHGQSHVRTTNDFCAKTCKDDSGCDKSKSEICDGLAFAVDEKTNDVSDTRYCISSTAPTANDAHGPEHGSSKTLPATK